MDKATFTNQVILGYNDDAATIQMYCVVITYCLVAIVANNLKAELLIYVILQISGVSLMDRTPVNEKLIEYDYKNVKELNYN